MFGIDPHNQRPHRLSRDSDTSNSWFTIIKRFPWATTLPAVAAALAAICSAIATFEVSSIARLTYEQDIMRIHFNYSIQERLDTLEIVLSQISGNSYPLDNVDLQPFFTTDDNPIPSPGKLTSKSPLVIPGTPYSLYVLQNVWKHICDNEKCQGRKLHSIRIEYYVFDQTREVFVKPPKEFSR